MPFCPKCGYEYSLGAGQCARCGTDLPRFPRPLQLEGVEGLPVPRLRRFVAGLIDMGIAYALFASLLLLLVSRRFLLIRAVRRGLAVVAPHVYLLLKDSLEGKSVGKLIVGLVAYNEKEKKATGLLDSIIRNWYLAIPFLGPTLIALVIGAQILSGRRKRLGDEGADTTVITDQDYQRLR